jgi:hypothetical protein
VSYSRPEAVSVGVLTSAHALMTSEAGNLSAPNWVTRFPDLTSSLASPTTTRYVVANTETFRDSFLSSFKNGSEAPLGRRWRRVVDALHGTEAGGQAGVFMLSTNESAGQDRGREKYDRDQERSDTERKERDMEKLYSAE